MLEFFANLFNTDDFPSRWHCGEWTARHGWLHILSDLATFGAYMAIPFVMIYFLRKRPDVPFPRVFYLFAAFIFACGTVHLIEAGIFWWPVYRLSGFFKFATAIVSWGTVAAAIAVAPKALTMRTATEMEKEIEERKRVETSLRESEERYRSLFDSISDLVQSVDTDGRVLFVNPAWVKTLGYTEEETVGRNIFEVIDEECREQCQNVLASLSPGQDVGLVEAVFIAKDGKKVPVEGNVSGRFVESRLVATHCFFRDVSERKAAEATRVSLGRILEESLNEIFIFDAETLRFVEVNRGARENIGYSMDELRQLTPVDIKPEYTAEEFEKLIVPLTSGRQEKIIFDTCHQRKDRSTYDVEVHLQQARVQDMLCYVAIIIDTTTRRRAEANAQFLDGLHPTLLRERDPSELIRHTLQSLGTHMETDLITFAEYTPDRATATVQQEFCDSRPSVLGTYRVDDFLTAEERVALNAGRDFVIENVADDLRTPEQTENWRRVQIEAGILAPLTNESGLVANIGVFSKKPRQWQAEEIQLVRDVAARLFPAVERARSEQARIESEERFREAQEKVVQSERLSAVGEAMTGLVHESRNALARSQAGLKLLSREIKDRPELFEYIDEALTAQKDLRHLFEEVRQYAVPPKLERQPVIIPDIVQMVWDQLENIRAGREVELRQHSDDVDVRHQLDGFSIGNVFRNLIENSFAACQDPVKIDVTYHDTVLNGDPALEITFRDNGPGLDGEQAKRVFDAFYTTKTHGAGLGMAISRRTVEAHGGTLILKSNDGEGAEFVITVPRDLP